MNNEYKKLLNEYLDIAKLRGRREQGIIGLRNRIPKLFNFLISQDLRLCDISVKTAYEYQGWLRKSKTKTGNPYKNRTILSYIIAASGFCEYLKSKGIIYSNPFSDIKRVRGEKKIPKNIPGEKEMDEFLCALSDFTNTKSLKNRITAYKVHVIAELMYGSALRISEVACLIVSDIDFTRGLIRVRDGKGGMQRMAYLNDYAKEILRLYINEMRELVFTEWNMRNSELLFGTGWGWLSHLVNSHLNMVAKKAGLNGFTSHIFRHAVGYHLLKSGCNIRYIQKILGHKLLRNTEIYTKVDKEDLKEVLDTCHPRRWEKVHV